MKKTLKSILSLILALTLVFSLVACSEKSSDDDDDEDEDEETMALVEDTYTVGIVQLVQHDALDKATQGFMDALTAKTTEAGKTVTFDLQTASGDTNICMTIANKFLAEEVDLIMANATPALQAAYASIVSIPILGTSVTDYGTALDFNNFNGVTGTNVSGTSDLAPLDMQAQMIIDLFPTAKTVGLLYCSAEANSLYQIEVVQAYLEGKGITCNSYPFESSNELSQIATVAVAECDVLYLPVDNTVASNAAIIDAIARPAKIPVITGEKSMCLDCGVATLSIDYYNLGYETGLMAAEILLEDADIAQMPIRYDTNPVYMYNPEICAELGITIPDDYVAIN